MANVATRWVLEQPAVGGVIIGARLGEREHRADNLRLFSFSLDDADRALIDAALAGAKRIPGDCGRRIPPPALSHRVRRSQPSSRKLFRRSTPPSRCPGRPNRLRIDTGSVWEPICGYSRAVRDRRAASWSAARPPRTAAATVVCKGDPRGQAVYVLDKIAASIEALGGALEDVVGPASMCATRAQWEAGCARARALSRPRPAGQHAGRGLQPGRRLRGRDRSGSGCRGLISAQPKLSSVAAARS